VMIRIRVCIFGSCVSRDILARMDPASYDLQLYSARSSFGSLFAEQPFEDEYSARLQSAFQKRTLAMDINKTAIPKFKTLKPDVVLVDLIDERFDLVRMPTGGRCTYSSELARAGFQLTQQTHVPSNSEEFFSHWLAGWKRFIKMMDARGMRDAIAVNRCYYSSHSVSGVPFPSSEVLPANAKLERMYAAQALDLGSHQFLDYPEGRSCPDDHRWGPSPYHYDDASNDFGARWFERFAEHRFDNMLDDDF